MTLIFDTNIVVSALIIPHGNEAQLLKLWYEKRFDLAVSEAILKEYNVVLRRDKFKHYFKYSSPKIDEFIENLIEVADLFPNTTAVDPIRRDRSDEKFLSCAIEAGADAIVSGDTKHLLPLNEYRGIPVITPKQCLDLFSPPIKNQR